ncbi:MAG: peptide ABC transporter permease, partial [Thermotogae bacterium]
MVPLLLGVLVMVFFMLRLIPGSPARRILGEYATPEAVAELEHQLGLDQPLHVQLVDFLTDYLRGDFGRSLRNRRPVFKEILRELPYTVELALGGLLLGTVFGVSMGILSAIRPNSWIDSLARVVALLGVSMPVYWSAILLILAFCIY